ncbi:MAG: hypothetical protein R3244_11085, partial [Thermoanaerobaculia bacterium]|nr:hypothetical protein [Thermoanaerobaculia bacterium]
MRKLNQRPLGPMRNGAGAATFLLLVGLATAPLKAGEEPTRFKILTEREGIHRISFEELERAGLPPGTDRLALTNRGRTVPMLRRDPDGRFGSGDEILFHAEHLEGEFSYYHEHTRYNVYFLELERAGSLFEPIDPPNASAASNPEPLLSGRRHFEKDKMLMRFGATGRAGSSDAWFWARLTQIDQEPFRLDLD